MKPLLLLTNDDGIESPGLRILMNLLKVDYELIVVAPKYPQSAKGCSHAHGDAWVSIEELNLDGVKSYTVDNSPATCTSVALRFLNVKPDLVVSGINNGENLGLNLFYSGTIGAAWESAMSGFLSLAVSLEMPPNMHYTLNENVDFSVSAYFTKKITKRLLEEKPSTLLWNLNVPSQATKASKIKEVKVGKQRWNYPIIRETRTHNNIQQVRFEYDPTGHSFSNNTDVSAIRSGFVSLVKIDSFHMPWVH